MLSTSEKKFSVLYSFLVLATLICGDTTALTEFNYIAKPLVALSLMVFFLIQSKALAKSRRILIAMALVFSVFGDTLLLFVERSPHYFLLGLVSFLIAHVLYVIAFLKDRNSTRKPYVFIVGLLVYALGLFYLLKDGLNDMLVPVMVYMFVILSMATAAYLRKGNVTINSYLLVLIGAVFFMVSDSLLAINKFYESFTYANISIMTTYALAQYCIVLGILKLAKTSR